MQKIWVKQMSELYLTAEELILNLNELRIPYKGGYRGLIVNTPAGLVISVQWGMSSYCSNRFADCRDWDQKKWLQTPNAEIWMWRHV